MVSQHKAVQRYVRVAEDYHQYEQDPEGKPLTVDVVKRALAALADSMELLLWGRKDEGNYTSPNKGMNSMRAYTRTLMPTSC